MKAIKGEGINSGYLFDGEATIYDNLYNEYPRPQLKRDSFFSLNGLWEFTITKDNKLPNIYEKKIQVPFPIEALDSGVKHLPTPKDYFYYHKFITIPEEFKDKKIIIHFEGVDQITRVFIDKKEVLFHIGMYDSFSIELDKNTPTRFELVLQVQDLSDTIYHSRGKQALAPVYWSYTTTTGVYKPIWMEAVNDIFITNCKFTPDFINNKIKVLIHSNQDCTAKIKIENQTYEIQTNKEISLDIGEFKYWSLNDPYLYNVDIEIPEMDHITTYFGIRKIEIKEINGFKRLYLNNEPIFISGILDQCYYGYNNLTPISFKDYKRDIELIKELGFNCIRVHVTNECDPFYYYADKLGVLLIQDFPNGGLPVGLMPVVWPRLFNFYNREKNITYSYLGRKDEEGRKEFINECNYYIEKYHNHPSIIIYTIFNEGWGEFDPSIIYSELKEKEDYMLFDTASGWYEADKSDFYSIHTYTKPNMKRKNRFNRCFILTEIGGVSLKYGNTPYEEFTGHGKCKKQEELNKKIENLYTKKILPQIKKYGLCLTIYTQFCDVESEYNGLYDLTRENCKVDKEMIKRLNKNLYDEYQSCFKNNKTPQS